MLLAGQDSPVPDVEFPLRRRGWYAIYFGIKSEGVESRLQVRLRNERVFTILAPAILADSDRRSTEPYTVRIEEMFWKCALLDEANDGVVLRQLRVQIVPGDPAGPGNLFTPCWLAYVKLVPLSASGTAALLADRGQQKTRRLFATDDAFSPAALLRFTSADDVRRQIEPYRDTDFSRLYWEAGMGDLMYYPSKIGSLATFSWVKQNCFVGDRLAGETYADFQAKGIDPFGVALDYSHEIGLEFHASYRVGGFHFPPPQEHWNHDGLYDRHPEWRCLDRSGKPMPRISYAFPGVREFVYSIFHELATYPIDGVSLLFNRSLPILGYEEPLASGFKEAYGADPRSLDEKDPRWMSYRASVLTGFMRELRGRLRDEERRLGRKPIAVTAVVMSSRDENYGYGLDLDAWVTEGLIDTLLPFSSVPGIDSYTPAWVDPSSAAYFIRLTKGTPCRLALDILPRAMPPEDYMRRVYALYAAGVENLCFWDTYSRTNFDRSWSILRRLGHKEELTQWAQSGSPAVEKPQGRLVRIGDWDWSYDTPG